MEALTGRITADAKVKEVSKEKKVVNFSVAVNDRYKTKDGRKIESVRYFNCAYWAGAGIAPFLLKGGLVELAGRIDLRVWNDREGKARGSLTLNVNTIKLHGKPIKESVVVPVQQQAAETTDDLPF